MEFLDNVATCNTSLIDEKIIFHRLKQAYATLYNTTFKSYGFLPTPRYTNVIFRNLIFSSSLGINQWFSKRGMCIMWRMCFKTMKKVLLTVFDVILDLNNSFFYVWTSRFERKSFAFYNRK